MTIQEVLNKLEYFKKEYGQDTKIELSIDMLDRASYARTSLFEIVKNEDFGGVTILFEGNDY